MGNRFPYTDGGFGTSGPSLGSDTPSRFIVHKDSWIRRIFHRLLDRSFYQSREFVLYVFKSFKRIFIKFLFSTTPRDFDRTTVGPPGVYIQEYWVDERFDLYRFKKKKKKNSCWRVKPPSKKTY